MTNIFIKNIKEYKNGHGHQVMDAKSINIVLAVNILK